MREFVFCPRIHIAMGSTYIAKMREPIRFDDRGCIGDTGGYRTPRAKEESEPPISLFSRCSQSADTFSGVHRDKVAHLKKPFIAPRMSRRTENSALSRPDYVSTIAEKWDPPVSWEMPSA